MPLTIYAVESILRRVPWTVEVTHQFELWWDTLSDDERISIDGMIRVLERHGPTGPPFSLAVAGSRHHQLRQLRVPHEPRELCLLYVSDESQPVVILLTGSSTDCDQFPPDLIEMADAIYDGYRRGGNGSEN